MNGAPNRRWLRYSLRTLFVVLTVVCIALGWDAGKVLERRAVLGQIQFREGSDLVDWSDLVRTNRRSVLASSARRRSSPMTGRSISPVRRLLGDRSIGFAAVYSDAEFESFRGRFPEATTLLFDDEATFLSAMATWEAAMKPPNATLVTDQSAPGPSDD
jgi:hypothetical protein